MATVIPFTVKTTVTFGGRAVSQAGFGNALFVSHHNVFTPRFQQYTDTDSMLESGFADGHPAVKWASGVFAGKQAPDFITIGRGAVDAYTIQVNEGAEEDDILSVNMDFNGTASSFAYTVLLADVGDSQALGDGLAALIQADAAITTATSDANGLITVVPASLVTPITFGVALNTTIFTTTSETPSEILTAIRAVMDDYSTVSSESHIKTDQDLYAIYAETADMLYLFSTSDTDTYSPVVTDDVFSIAKGKQYQYTTGVFNEQSDIEFPEGAMAGTFLNLSPSYNFTLNLQDLVGITPSNLTQDQKSALITKNGNFYELEYGVGTLKEGFTSNGDFIDRSRFGLWLKLRSQESMFTTMKGLADRSSALAYSDAGISIVRSNLYTDVINVGIRNGAILSGFSQDSAGKTISYQPIVDTSTRANQTNTAIGQRLWEGFEIEVVYNSSIHHIDSNGYIVNNRVAG